MNRILNRIFSFPIVALFLIFTALSGIGESVNKNYGSPAPILDSAESFFKSLKNSEYGATWDLLTENSRETIMKEVYESSRSMNADIDKSDIIQDFARRGVMFKSYWSSFRRTLDTDIILNNSQWEMGQIGQDKAEIIISVRKSSNPTVLKMQKEGNKWKVGLIETFWKRKSLKLLNLIFR